MKHLLLLHIPLPVVKVIFILKIVAGAAAAAAKPILDGFLCSFDRPGVYFRYCFAIITTLRMHPWSEMVKTWSNNVADFLE